jgi:integrase
MSSINFRIRSSANKKVTIKIYLSLGRKNFIEVNSGFSIHPNDWSSKTNLPMQNKPENKDLLANLKKLEAYVHNQLNESQGDGVFLDRFWLEKTIDKCFNRVKSSDTSLVLNHIQYIIDNAHSRKIKGKKNLGLSDSRVKSYITFKGIMTEYQTLNKKPIQFNDISKKFIDDFTNWLLAKKHYSKNYAGKQIDNLKTVCLDAEKLGIQINSYIPLIESFSESDEDRLIVTFSFAELAQIKKSKMPNEYLENAKKWLLFGCEIGQRGSDLLSISTNNLRVVDGHLFVDVIQQKTKKHVTIPIGSSEIRKMLEHDFPRPITQQKLNNYIKTVCEWSGITEMTEGKILSKETKRKIAGWFPKYQLVSSHSFRRSFATNYYKKIATPILMTITGHSKESMFLKYINKQEDKDENAKLFLHYYRELKI